MHARKMDVDVVENNKTVRKSYKVNQLFFQAWNAKRPTHPYVLYML